jgi:hypothetical protein
VKEGIAFWLDRVKEPIIHRHKQGVVPFPSRMMEAVKTRTIHHPFERGMHIPLGEKLHIAVANSIQKIKDQKIGEKPEGREQANPPNDQDRERKEYEITHAFKDGKSES